MQAEIAAGEGEIVEASKVAGVPTDAPEETIDRHCKPEVKARLENSTIEQLEVSFKANDKKTGLGNGFDEQMEVTHRQSLVKNEEFLLGLLMMHQTRGNWVYEQYLDAVCTFSDESPLIAKLYKVHKKDKPLAFQLAEMMDSERKQMTPTKAPPLQLDDAVKGILGKVGLKPGQKVK